MNTNPVIVLGTGLTALGVLRVLARAGVDTYVHGWPEGLERRSRWLRRLPLDRAAPGSATGLPGVLEASRIESAVLFPCTDHWAVEVADLPAALGTRFPASSAPLSALQALTDKARFSRLLAETAIPHPLTMLLESPADVDLVDDAALEGAFLKPHDSQAFFARYGVKGFHVNSRAEAIDRVAEVTKAGLAVLLQQYIPGPGSLHYFVDGFVDAAGGLQAVFARHRLRMYPEDFGNSSCMVSVPLEDVGQAIESLKVILPRLRYRGIFSAEFKRDPRDGVYKLLEVNARPWWYVEFAARCGADVCRMAYDDALGRPVEPIRAYSVGARMVYPYYDFFACREAWRRGELGLVTWARSWTGAQNPLFNWTDPMPALEGLWSPIGRRLGRPRKAS